MTDRSGLVIDALEPRREPAAAPDRQAWPRPAQAWYTVTVLSVVLMLSQLDRGVITLLVKPIKHDLQLSDTQMSELLGLAFIVLYMFLGIPLARISDRKSRRTMIAGGVAFWSLATACCGLAQNFWQLFACRVGIGAGEAVNGPATYSLLADCFPREKLPRALAVLNLGFLAGTGCSLLIGAAVIKLLPSVSDFHLFGVGTVHNWQLVFLAVGLPGLLIAVLMFTVREPMRRGRAAVPAEAVIPFREVLRYLADNWRVYGPMFLSLALSSLGSTGGTSWMPTMFQRTYGWSAAEAGATLGMMGLIIGPFGLFASIWLVERYNRLGYDDANLRVVRLAYCLALPFSIAGPLMPSATLAIACVGCGGFFALIGVPPATAALQSITPNRMRGQISSMYLLMLSAIGMGVGPIIVARVTDYVFRSEDMLRYSMSLTAAVLAPAATVVIWLGVKPYGRAIARLRKTEL